MVLEIALGIVLAVIILSFLPYIIAGGVIALGIAALAFLGIGGYALLAAGWEQDHLSGFFGIVAVLAVLGAWGWMSVVVQKHTKVSAPEAMGVSILATIAFYCAYLVFGALIGDGDHIGNYSFGLVLTLAMLGWLTLGIIHRYKESGAIQFWLVSWVSVITVSIAAIASIYYVQKTRADDRKQEDSWASPPPGVKNLMRHSTWRSFEFRDPNYGQFLATRASSEDPRNQISFNITFAPQAKGCKEMIEVIVKLPVPSSATLEREALIELQVDDRAPKAVVIEEDATIGERFVYLRVKEALPVAELLGKRSLKVNTRRFGKGEYPYEGLAAAVQAARDGCDAFVPR